MSPEFHALTIADIERFDDFAIAVRFAVPAHLVDAYAFTPGQYLTLRAEIDGVDCRRPYSICTGCDEADIGVGIKYVEGGHFSGYALAHFTVGQQVYVMPPQGRFMAAIDTPKNYLLLAAGSGITPMMSITRSLLARADDSQITLVYGNRSTSTIMFRGVVEDMKDRYMSQVRLLHILSQEMRDIEMLNGRIDSGKIRQLITAGLIDIDALDDAFICGPASMIDESIVALMAGGMDREAIHFERFVPSGDAANTTHQPAKMPIAVRSTTHDVAVMLDGTRRQFAIDPAQQTVLQAGQSAGLDLPFSCAAGMCCTCRCKVVAGAAKMDANYALEPWELDAGFILSCQARPTSAMLELNFDTQ